MVIVLPIALQYILQDKLDTEFRIDLQKYRQFSECSTDKIVKEVHDYITIKRYNNDTADMFLYAFANIYQTEGKQCWNRHSLQLQSDNSSL